LLYLTDAKECFSCKRILFLKTQKRFSSLKRRIKFLEQEKNPFQLGKKFFYFAGSGGHEKRKWYEGPIWWKRGSLGYSLVLKSTKKPLNSFQQVLVAVKSEDWALRSDGRVCKGL